MTARKVDEVSVTADHVELSFRDQYIGRSDMWRFSQAMVDTCVYEGKTITFAGCIRAQVKGIYVNGQQHASGYVSETTKAIFRSESSKFFIFIQMCQEMWEFDEDGEIFYEKAINGFLPELFARWKKLNTNHVVSVVLFTRIYYDERDTDQDDPTLIADYNGKWYRDFYKVVVNMETSQEWMTYIKQLKTEVLHFQRDILLKGDERKVTLAAQNAYAFQGNILEAINLALNSFDEHYVDRDLLRTGLSIIVITPGTGQFQVNKRLLRLTTERMIDNGIGLDLVCLSKVPLHTVPLFKFPAAKPPEPQSAITKAGRKDLRGMDREVTPDTRDPLYYDGPDEQSNLHMYYAMPHWIDASFYSRNQDQPFKSERFVTRCKMYEVQMMGIMEHEIASIAIPLLHEDANFWSDVSSKSLGDDKYLRYDSAVFKTTMVAALPEKLSGNTVRNDKGNGLHVEHTTSRPKQVPLVSELSRSLRSEGFGQRKLLTAQSDFDDAQERLASQKLAEGDAIDLETTDVSQAAHPRGINIERPQATEEHPEDGVFGSSTVKPISIRTTKNIKLPRGHPRGSPASVHSFEDTVFKWDENAGRIPRLLNNSGPSPGHNSPGRQGYKQTLINPSNPDKSNIPVSSQLRRWHHVFPKSHTGKSVRWKSMCTPACLPLSTDYFPSAEDLSNHFQEYTYTISIDPDATSSYPGLVDTSPASLLTEMLSQRLAQGFQLIVGDSVNAHAKRSGPTSVTRGFSISEYKPTLRGTSKAMYNVVQGIDNAGTAPPVYLFMSHHFHRLLYDPAGQNVEVKRYVQKLGYSTQRTRYSCVIWPKSTPGYRAAQTSFAYPDVASYKWNYMDQLIAGYQDDIDDSLKVWKTRFCLIPLEHISTMTLDNGDKIDEEEIRVVGIFKFRDLFQKAKWKPKDEESADQEDAAAGLTMRFTTFSPSVDVANEFAEAENEFGISEKAGQSSKKNEGLDRKSPLKTIAQEMAKDVNGLKMENKHWHLYIYKNAFIGFDYVNWLIKHFSDIHTREEAEEFGNVLMENGLFEHCNKRHRFMDGQYFYALRPEYAPAKQSKSWFKRSSSDTLSISSNTTGSTNHSAKSEDTLRDLKRKLRVEMTKTMTIDVDPSHKSGRPETAFLHYDSIYNPDECYHFQLHWLGTTARFVEDTVQSWSRTADKWGLKLVEVPVNQIKIFDNDNPFQSPVLIKLACMPPALASVGRKLHPQATPEYYFETQLVKKFKFILDIEADDSFPSGVDIVYSYRKPRYERTQYLHRSGVAIIQIQEAEKGLLWVHNRLYTSHISSAERQNQKQMAAIPNVTQLRYEFIDFCADKEKLQAFWDEQVEKLPFADSNEKMDVAEAITEALDEKEA